MALAAKVTAEQLAALPEPLRGVYKQGTDGFILDAEGVEDVTGLKKVLEEAKTDRTQLREKMKAYEGIDPEVARKALADLEKLNDKKLIDEGKVEELLQKRMETATKSHAQQLKEWEAKHGEESKRATDLQARLESVLVDNGLRSAGSTAGVKKSALQDLVLRGQKVWKLHEGAATPFRDDGTVLFGKNPSVPMTMEEWVESLRDEAPHLFEGNKGAGTGPGLGRLSGNRVSITRADARNAQLYKAAEAEAKKSGAQLVIVD
jgi:hypothetical protein